MYLRRRSCRSRTRRSRHSQQRRRHTSYREINELEFAFWISALEHLIEGDPGLGSVEVVAYQGDILFEKVVWVGLLPIAKICMGWGS